MARTSWSRRPATGKRGFPRGPAPDSGSLMGRPSAPMPLAQVIWFRERLGEKQLSVRAIEHVEESVAIGLDHQLARLTLPVGVDQHRRFRGVPIPKIVRRELVIPLELSGLGVESQDAVGVKVVALALVAVVFGGGIAGGPVDGIELGVVGAGEPGRRSAMLDACALPGLRFRLARQRHRPEAPDFFAGGLIVGGDETARAAFAASRTGHDQIADGERRRRGEVVLLGVRHLGVPELLAREPVQRQDVGVTAHHEHAVARPPPRRDWGRCRRRRWFAVADAESARSGVRCRRRARSTRWSRRRT